MTEGQMSFEDVVELEHQVGDPEYTAWLAAGRPKLGPQPDEHADPERDQQQ